MSFYHSTAQYEPFVRSESNRLLGRLWTDYIHVGADDQGPCAKFAPFARRPVDQSLRINGDEVSFSMSFLIGGGIGRGYQIQPTMRFSLTQNLDVPQRLPPGKGRPDHYKELIIGDLPVYPDLDTPNSQAILARCLFPNSYYDKVPRNTAILSLSPDIEDDLKRLAKVIRGFPPPDNAGFWRMFYLSASTITTAGFGDIVPLTTKARIAVSLEAIVGVIFIGIFLNAIAARLSRKPGSADVSQ